MTTPRDKPKSAATATSSISEPAKKTTEDLKTITTQYAKLMLDLKNQIRDITATIPMLKSLFRQKRESRLEKGKEFNCFVLEAASGEKDEDESIEMDDFFNHLSKNIQIFPDKTRFHLAICDLKTNHWYTVDCYIQKGILHTLVVDPSCVKKTLEDVLSVVTQLFPSGKHYFFYGDRSERGILQYTQQDCVAFTRELIAAISRIDPDDLYRILEKSTVKSAIKDAHYFTLSQLKGEMALLAPITRGMQSKKGIEKLSMDAKNTQVSKSKNLTLAEWHTAHEDSGMNLTIAVKGKKYIGEFKHLNHGSSFIDFASLADSFALFPEATILKKQLETLTVDKIKLFLNLFINDLKGIPQPKTFMISVDNAYSQIINYHLAQLNILVEKCNDQDIKPKKIAQIFSEIILNLVEYFYNNDLNDVLKHLKNICLKYTNQEIQDLFLAAQANNLSLKYDPVNHIIKAPLNKDAKETISFELIEFFINEKCKFQDGHYNVSADKWAKFAAKLKELSVAPTLKPPADVKSIKPT